LKNCAVKITVKSCCGMLFQPPFSAEIPYHYANFSRTMSVFDEKRNTIPVETIYLKNWKLIAGVVLLCTIGAVIFTMMLTPRYRAKAAFFIPYTISLEQTVENPQFGYDVEADRLLQLLHSEQLKDSVIRKFNLVKYYEIDTTKYGWQAGLNELYDQRFISNRTNVMSIVVEAETHDPKFSAQIVDYIVKLAGRMRERFMKTNSQLAGERFRVDYDHKKAEVDSLRSRILTIRKALGESNVTVMESQILVNNKVSSSDAAQQLELEALSQQHINEQKRLGELKEKFENAVNMSNSPIPQFYILDEATPLYKKAYPLTMFNICIGFFGSLFLMLTGLYLKHVVQVIRQKK
jgi:uncharacterized protein involved in exopolysaccharide biosynthesis